MKANGKDTGNLMRHYNRVLLLLFILFGILLFVQGCQCTIANSTWHAIV